MDLSGTVDLSVRPDEATEGFHTAETLRHFLPGKSELTKSGPAAFDFVVTKDAGMVSLRLPGTLTIQPDGETYRFEAAARHLLGGTANLLLNIRFAPAEFGEGTVMSYAGTLAATGLAGRLLRDRAPMAQEVLTARFEQVKRHLEIMYAGLPGDVYE